MDSLALASGQTLSRAFSGVVRAATRHVRWTVFVSILLIFGSFVSAAVIQMQRDHAHALSQAAVLESRRAQELALDFSSIADRYAALATAFTNSEPSVETSAALSEAGGPALENIAVLNGSGQLLFEMKRRPTDLLPLDPGLLSKIVHRRTFYSAGAGRSIVLGFPESSHLVLIQLAADKLFPQASMEDDLFATGDGDLLALGRNWRELPPRDLLRLEGYSSSIRTITMRSGARLLALASVGKWPITAGASVQVGEALSGWYGALPLYFFFILGPAFAGAGLAVVFVRELERRTRPYSADRMLRAKRNEEARLLIRLADAERRAAEAERSKGEFITHMSHELRTPLNAIIGFSEVIEQGLFGKAGHPKYEEYAHDIGQAGRKLHARIDEILQFAELEAGKQPISLESIDAGQLVRQAASEIAGHAFARAIRITVSVSGGAHARADAVALKRSLVNLLHNSLQHTSDGGQVRVHIRGEGNWLVIALVDCGASLAADATRAHQRLQYIESPGVRASAGLGLAIAGSLIRRMEGTLTVSARKGEGPVVEVRLRRA